MLIVLSTSEGVRTTVNALQSIDGSKGVSWMDHCVRLLVNSTGRHLPEDEIREDLKPLSICIEGGCSSAPRRGEQEAFKTRPLTWYIIVPVAL